MNPTEWDIRREGRSWTRDEFQRRLYQAPEKIEFVGGIFSSERQRLTVLGMLLENLGIDKAVRFGSQADWKAALADQEDSPLLLNATLRTTTRPLSCPEVLKIAHDDAQRVYRDLSAYSISLVLELDGWHVDYDLTAPMTAGGGPRYVIDPNTGAILSKRYEQ